MYICVLVDSDNLENISLDGNEETCEGSFLEELKDDTMQMDTSKQTVDMLRNKETNKHTTLVQKSCAIEVTGFEKSTSYDKIKWHFEIETRETVEYVWFSHDKKKCVVTFKSRQGLL